MTPDAPDVAEMALLAKYMDHVRDCEGRTYTDAWDFRNSKVKLTRAEKYQLRAIAARLRRGGDHDAGRKAWSRDEAIVNIHVRDMRVKHLFGSA